MYRAHRGVYWDAYGYAFRARDLTILSAQGPRAGDHGLPRIFLLLLIVRDFEGNWDLPEKKLPKLERLIAARV